MSRFKSIRITCLVTAALLAAAAAGAGGRESGERETAEPVTKLVLIPGGEFLMGQEDGVANNTPVHKVRVGSFYIDEHEVTNAQYQRFCTETDRALPIYWGMERFRCGPDYADHPVVGVSWADAKAYAEWAGKRLPTEAEWEYAARGGLSGKKFPYGDEMEKSAANFKSEGTVAVVTYPPNGYGLYDMSGNVREWVSDYYEEFYYAGSPEDNPTGPEKASFHVVRDGGWHSGKSCCSVASRICLPTYWVDFAVGFRCAKDAE